MSTSLIILLALVLLFGALTAALLRARRRSGDLIHPPENLEVTSPAFDQDGAMPRRYSGRGEDVSPALELGDLSPQAQSVSVVMDDLDHPAGVFNHWVIWNLPVARHVPEAVPHGEVLTSLGNAVQGKSAYGGKHYYRGPKPPFGTHRYAFKVYVLDTRLDLPPSARKAELQQAMDRHVLQFGTLTGAFGSGAKDATGSAGVAGRTTDSA